MGKAVPTPRDNEIDIFADDDLAMAQQALEAATGEPPRASVEGPVLGDWAGELTESPQPVGQPLVEATDAHLKFRVRPSSRGKFDEFKTELSIALGGARLVDSNVGRAVIDWFMGEGAPIVLRYLEANPTELQRPASDDQVAMAEFDAAIAKLVAHALQRR